MKDKIPLGVVSVVMGILLFVSIIIPWYSGSIILLGKINFYPFYEGSGGNIRNLMDYQYSYISGILVVVAALISIISGSVMITKPRSKSGNISSLLAGLIALIAFGVYLVFVSKISPDVNHNIFYGSGTGYSYGLQLGLYLEVASGAVLFILSLIYMI
jgi:phosphoglycerol transferase MdoB-like AlkP superfamily enzyme